MITWLCTALLTLESLDQRPGKGLFSTSCLAIDDVALGYLTQLNAALEVAYYVLMSDYVCEIYHIYQPPYN